MTRLETFVLAALILATLVVIAGNTHLPMNDAPSHIATAAVFEGLLKGDDFFARHYRFVAVPLPYWATTLALFPLDSLFGPLRGFVVLIAAYAVLLPLSFHFLASRAAPENRPLALVAALAVFNWSYWLGEANFFLGQPVVLFAFGLFLGISRVRSLRFVGFVVLAAVAYLCHIYALTALLIALGALGLSSLLWPRMARTLAGRDAVPRLVPAQWIAALGVLALFSVAAYLVLVQHGTTANRGRLVFDLSPKRLAHVGIEPFDSPSQPPAPLLLTLPALVAAVWLLPRLRPLGGPTTLADALNPTLLAPALALAGATWLGPVSILNPDGSVKESEIALRFVLPAFLFGMGAVRLPASLAWRRLLLAGVIAFGCFKLADAWRIHRRFDASMARIEAEILSRIPERSRLLPLKDVARLTPVQYLFHRIGNYAVVERHSYSPHVFAVLGQHALRHVRWGDFRSLSDRHVRDEEWDYYDYVLVQTERPRPDVEGLEQRARLVAEAEGFQLYRVLKKSTSPVGERAPDQRGEQ